MVLVNLAKKRNTTQTWSNGFLAWAPQKDPGLEACDPHACGDPVSWDKAPGSQAAGPRLDETPPGSTLQAAHPVGLGFPRDRAPASPTPRCGVTAASPPSPAPPHPRSSPAEQTRAGCSYQALGPGGRAAGVATAVRILTPDKGFVGSAPWAGARAGRQPQPGGLRSCARRPDGPGRVLNLLFPPIHHAETTFQFKQQSSAQLLPDGHRKPMAQGTVT